jgi:Outer membrane protein beta-barrel domain
MTENLYRFSVIILIIALAGCANNKAFESEVTSINKTFELGTNTTRAGISNSAIVGNTKEGESYKVYKRDKVNVGIFSDFKFKNHNFETGIHLLNAEFVHKQTESNSGGTLRKFGMLRFPLTYTYKIGNRFGDSILRLRAGFSTGILVWAEGSGSCCFSGESSNKTNLSDIISFGPTLGASYTFCKIGRKSWLGMYFDLYRGIKSVDLAYQKFGLELRYNN